MAMPRPTVAQFAYGSCTVVLSTLALLLASRTSSAAGTAAVAVAALALGLLVAVKAPGARRTRRLSVVHPAPARPAPAASAKPVRATVPAPVRESVREPVRERAAS
ncbi:hypothetical protein GCM10009535_31800 [Streptomyces thermocarboxydovorans]|uniref:Secreted protein n=1 Tax=Streptomyces thermocarboxydovorans TaxID=59298 RepID=A0ABP3SSI4_9ACTN